MGFQLRRRTLLAGPPSAILLVGLAGCQPPVDPAITNNRGPHKAAFLIFRAQINEQTRGFFQRDIDAMIARGVTEVRIGISSPGGRIASAEAMMAYMDQQHRDRGILFTTYNVGLVASAACYVFLAGQRRFSVPRGNFLFHQASMMVNGQVTSQALREGADIIAQEEKRFLQVLTTRTKLTEGEALSFVRRTVILTAPEARRDGIIEGIGDYLVPPGVDPADIRAASDTTPLPITRTAPVG